MGSIAIQLAKHLGATVAATASSANAEFLRELGADTIIDYGSQDSAELLENYDLVLDSLGGVNLEKSLRVLKPGGKAIGISGPPDPAFAREVGLNPVLRLAITVLSAKVRRQARKLAVRYEFLFMHASGDQLRHVTALIDDGALRPVVGRILPLEQTAKALKAWRRVASKERRSSPSISAESGPPPARCRPPSRR